MHNIAIAGRKRSGKDTAAAHLVEEFGYVRHGFADPLKDAALKLDPIIEHIYMGHRAGCPVLEPYRLSELIADDGWEEAKDSYPEVRRILQRLGDEAGRQVHGEETWIRNLLRRAEASNAEGHPVVVPDVRYPNEAELLREAGFLVVRVDRPGYGSPTPGEHASERVERLAVDQVIVNDGSLHQLHAAISVLV